MNSISNDGIKFKKILLDDSIKSIIIMSHNSPDDDAIGSMKTLEDYIREYDLEQISNTNYYNFKNPCHYPIMGILFEFSSIEPLNVFAATCIFATETCIEYAGWNRLYPEDYERYFAQMQKEYNTAISLSIKHTI